MGRQKQALQTVRPCAGARDRELRLLRAPNGRPSRPLDVATANARTLDGGHGDVDGSHRSLVRSIERELTNPRPDERSVVAALHCLEQLCSMGGRPELWDAYRTVLSHLPPPLPITLNLTSSLVADPCHASPEVLRCLDSTITSLDEQTDPMHAVWVAVASTGVDRLPDCRRVLWHLLRDRPATGSSALIITALTLLATDYLLTGRWDEADRLSDEGVHLCDRTGYDALGWYVRQIKAQLAALRGDEKTAHRMTDEIMRWAVPRRVGACRAFRSLVLHETALGRGDFETAYQCAISITPTGHLPTRVPYAGYALLGHVEASVRSGHRREAAAHVRSMERAHLQSVSSRLALVVAGAQAMVAAAPCATELYERAVLLRGADQWPFELARVELAFGEHLRRSRAITQARAHLSSALTTFDALEAKPWSERAIAELRATGAARRPADPDRGQTLTAQEFQVASLAARGLTNKEIGERLYISPRTVGAHLYRMFPKLGITTRAALRDALTSRGHDHRG